MQTILPVLYLSIRYSPDLKNVRKTKSSHANFNGTLKERRFVVVIFHAPPSRPENTRYSGRSYSASSIAASDRPNHCCKMPHGTPHSSPLDRLVCVCALHLSEAKLNVLVYIAAIEESSQAYRPSFMQSFLNINYCPLRFITERFNAIR